MGGVLINKLKQLKDMATCDINSGRILSCKDAISGLKTVYFVNYEDVYGASGDTVTYNPLTEEIDGVTTPGTTNAYKYDLHLGNDLTQNIQSSPENGTLYFEQVLSITLKKLSSADNVQIKTLASGRPLIYVEDQMGNIMLVGRVNGADVTAGTAVTGNAFGDLNGYTLSFTGQEPTLANFYATPESFATDYVIVAGA